jgi:hypothetical protein
MVADEFGKDSEGSGHGLTKILFLHLPGGTRKNGKILRVSRILAKIQTQTNL